MATTNSFVESRLTADDLTSAQALVVQAGWNQNQADWRVFLELGRGFAIWAAEGTLAATAATLPYPSGFGWISMILVSSAWRRQGIATRLLNQCVDTIRSASLVPALDATPAGCEVYRRLGFRSTWRITRWRHRGSVKSIFESGDVRPLEERDWPALLLLDADCCGYDRSKLLRRLFDRSGGVACVAEVKDQLAGFLFARDGRVATQLGPVVAKDAHTAVSLVGYAAARVATAVLLDSLDEHVEFENWLCSWGFERERPFTRMILGRDDFFSSDASRTFAIAGPEFG